MGKKELDLDNPVFVVYLNVDGMTSQRAGELIQNYQKMLNFQNCTFWIVAVQDQKTKFEMIWKGKNYEINSTFDSEKSIRFLKERMSKLMDMLADGTSDEILKQKLRDFSLSQLIDE